LTLRRSRREITPREIEVFLLHFFQFVTVGIGNFIELQKAGIFHKVSNYRASAIRERVVFPGYRIRRLNVGSAGEFFLAAYLSDGGVELVVGLDPVLRAVDMALQLRVAQVAQGVDAANQLV
jgi:hypothetical protein